MKALDGNCTSMLSSKNCIQRIFGVLDVLKPISLRTPVAPLTRPFDVSTLTVIIYLAVVFKISEIYLTLRFTKYPCAMQWSLEFPCLFTIFCDVVHRLPLRDAVILMAGTNKIFVSALAPR